MRRKRLGSLMTSAQYVEVQKEAPALIGWVDSLLEELLNAQFSPEARAARGRAGLAASAPALIAECRSQGQATLHPGSTRAKPRSWRQVCLSP